MRARRKKHSLTRIDACGDIVASNPFENVGIWKEKFKNNHPIYLEIGCGKGNFITQLAKENPQNNYIAIEKNASVLVVAIEKALQFHLDNLLFCLTDSNHLDYVFKEGEIEGIYLNFSDPWPQNKKAKRRLTYRSFLDTYYKLLKNNGEIYFKTDNKRLFEFSLNELCFCDYKLKDITFDLHHSGFEENILTEYEEKFSNLGYPIYRVVAIKREK